MTTALQDISEAVSRMEGNALRLWLLQSIPHLLEKEKGQIVEAWVAGNADGWAMATDWPEDGERYYEQKFNNIIKG